MAAMKVKGGAFYSPQETVSIRNAKRTHLNNLLQEAQEYAMVLGMDQRIVSMIQQAQKEVMKFDPTR